MSGLGREKRFARCLFVLGFRNKGRKRGRKGGREGGREGRKGRKEGRNESNLKPTLNTYEPTINNNQTNCKATQHTTKTCKNEFKDTLSRS